MAANLGGMEQGSQEPAGSLRRLLAWLRGAGQGAVVALDRLVLVLLASVVGALSADVITFDPVQIALLAGGIVGGALAGVGIFVFGRRIVNASGLLFLLRRLLPAAPLASYLVIAFIFRPAGPACATDCLEFQKLAAQIIPVLGLALVIEARALTSLPVVSDRILTGGTVALLVLGEVDALRAVLYDQPVYVARIWASLTAGAVAIICLAFLLRPEGQVSGTPTSEH